MSDVALRASCSSRCDLFGAIFDHNRAKVSKVLRCSSLANRIIPATTPARVAVVAAGNQSPQLSPLYPQKMTWSVSHVIRHASTVPGPLQPAPGRQSCKSSHRKPSWPIWPMAVVSINRSLARRLTISDLVPDVAFIRSVVSIIGSTLCLIISYPRLNSGSSSQTACHYIDFDLSCQSTR